ncbi:MAG: hypothetical protein WCC32_12445 [Terriglobales bacterium]
MLAEGREHRKFTAAIRGTRRDMDVAEIEDCHQGYHELLLTVVATRRGAGRLSGALFLFFFSFFFFPVAEEQLHENSGDQRTDESDPEPQRIPALESKPKYQDAQKGHDSGEKRFESPPGALGRRGGVRELAGKITLRRWAASHGKSAPSQWP